MELSGRRHAARVISLVRQESSVTGHPVRADCSALAHPVRADFSAGWAADEALARTTGGSVGLLGAAEMSVGLLEAAVVVSAGRLAA